MESPDGGYGRLRGSCGDCARNPVVVIVHFGVVSISPWYTTLAHVRPADDTHKEPCLVKFHHERASTVSFAGVHHGRLIIVPGAEHVVCDLRCQLRHFITHQTSTRSCCTLSQCFAIGVYFRLK